MCSFLRRSHPSSFCGLEKLESHCYEIQASMILWPWISVYKGSVNDFLPNKRTRRSTGFLEPLVFLLLARKRLPCREETCFHFLPNILDFRERKALKVKNLIKWCPAVIRPALLDFRLSSWPKLILPNHLFDLRIESIPDKLMIKDLPTRQWPYTDSLRRWNITAG